MQDSSRGRPHAGHAPNPHGAILLQPLLGSSSHHATPPHASHAALLAVTLNHALLGSIMLDMVILLQPLLGSSPHHATPPHASHAALLASKDGSPTGSLTTCPFHGIHTSMASAGAQEFFMAPSWHPCMGVTFHTDTLPKQCPIMAPFAADFQARKCTTHPVSDKSGAASQLCGLPPYGYVHVLLKKRGDRQASPCFALRLLLCFIREPSLPLRQAVLLEEDQGMLERDSTYNARLRVLRKFRVPSLLASKSGHSYNCASVPTTSIIASRLIFA
eukprot:951162-Pelagomonas_calceolata.AAC.2